MIKTIALFSIFLMAVTFTAIEWSDVSQHEPVSAKNYWPYIKARSHYYHPPTLGRVNNTDYSQSKTVPVLWLQWFSCWVLRTAISRAQPPRAGQSSRKLVIKARYWFTPWWGERVWSWRFHSADNDVPQSEYSLYSNITIQLSWRRISYSGWTSFGFTKKWKSVNPRIGLFIS